MHQTLIRNDQPRRDAPTGTAAISGRDLKQLERGPTAQQPPQATGVHEHDLTRLAGEGALIATLLTVAIGAMLVAASILHQPTSELTWAAKASTTIAAGLAIAILPVAAIDALRR